MKNRADTQNNTPFPGDPAGSPTDLTPQQQLQACGFALSEDVAGTAEGDELEATLADIFRTILSSAPKGE